MTIGDSGGAYISRPELVPIFLQEIDIVEIQLFPGKQATDALDTVLPHERDPARDISGAYRMKVKPGPLRAVYDLLPLISRTEVVLHSPPIDHDQ